VPTEIYFLDHHYKNYSSTQHLTSPASYKLQLRMSRSAFKQVTVHVTFSLYDCYTCYHRRRHGFEFGSTKIFL